MREGREREAQRPREDTEVKGPEVSLSKDQPEASRAAEREGWWGMGSGARGELGLILSTVGNPGGFQRGGVACFQGMAVAAV